MRPAGPLPRSWRKSSRPRAHGAEPGEADRLPRRPRRPAIQRETRASVSTGVGAADLGDGGGVVSRSAADVRAVPLRAVQRPLPRVPSPAPRDGPAPRRRHTLPTSPPVPKPCCDGRWVLDGRLVGMTAARIGPPAPNCRPRTCHSTISASAHAFADIGHLDDPVAMSGLITALSARPTRGPAE